MLHRDKIGTLSLGLDHALFGLEAAIYIQLIVTLDNAERRLCGQTCHLVSATEWLL